MGNCSKNSRDCQNIEFEGKDKQIKKNFGKDKDEYVCLDGTCRKSVPCQIDPGCISSD